MGTRTATLVLLLASVSPAWAQSRPAQPDDHNRVLWTSVGAAAGFGAGFYIGFMRFDGATYAERKILTTAIVGGVAGGLTGWFLSRDKSTTAPSSLPIRNRLSARERRAQQFIERGIVENFSLRLAQPAAATSSAEATHQATTPGKGSHDR